MTNSHGNPLTFGLRSNTKVLKFRSKQTTNKLVKAHNEAKLSAYRAYWDRFDADLYKEVQTIKQFK